MSLQALVPIAKNVGGQLARAGLQAVKKRRQSRIAQNKWVMGARVMGIPFDPSTTIRGRRKQRKNNGRARSTIGAPVKRMNAGTVLRNIAQTVRDSDNLNVLRRNVNTDPKIIQKYIITPTAEALFPRLYQIARTYQKYSCLSLGIGYVNSAATTLNGTLHMCFVPRVDVDPHEFTEPEDFACIPGYQYTSVSRPVRMNVPVEQMNKRGQELYCSNGTTTADADEPLLFLTGTLCILVESLDVGSGPTDYGQLTVDYCFSLKDPVIDKTTSSSAVFSMNTTTPVVENPRSFSAEVEDNEFSVVKRKPCALVVRTDNTEHTGLLLDGEVQTPVMETVSYDALNAIRWYSFPRLTRRNRFSIMNDRPAHVMLLEMESGLVTAFDATVTNPLIPTKMAFNGCVGVNIPTTTTSATTTTTTTATAATPPKHAHRLSNQ